MTLKTLSKITRALLYALMVLVAALMAALFVSADVRTFMENEYGAAGSTVLFYAMLLVCGGIALWILIELAAVLKTVESDPFVERNAAAFMRMGIAAEAAGLVFFVKCFFMFTIMTAVCALVMILSGLFALTLGMSEGPLSTSGKTSLPFDAEGSMIRVNLDIMLARRGVSGGELAEAIGITQANLSILKTNKGKAIRFSTLDAICKKLNCTPGDILEYVEDNNGAE